MAKSTDTSAAEVASSTRARQGRPPKGEEPDWERFLLELADIPNAARAARVIGVSYQAAKKKREVDEDFAARWEAALDEGIEETQGTVHLMANGRWKGEDPDAAPPDMRAALAQLRAYRPDKWTPAIALKGGATLAELRAMDDKALEERLQRRGVLPNPS